MAIRPVFAPNFSKPNPAVDIVNINFEWHPGFAISQKQKSIASLHKGAFDKGIEHTLEISSKSECDIGRQLSAFNLLLSSKTEQPCIPVELAFQSSKKFEYGGPFKDLLLSTPKDAKRDPRLTTNGKIVEFEFEGTSFSTEPKTSFYDWLFVNAIHQNPELGRELLNYNGFTDIEFNPKRSANCQAYSCALYVAIVKLEKLKYALTSQNNFLAILSDEYSDKKLQKPVQEKLF